jgi:hypothetical protein
MEILQLLCSRRFPLANTPQLRNHHSIRQVFFSLLYLQPFPGNGFNNGYSSVSCTQVPSSESPVQNSTEAITPTVLVIISRHEPHRKHRSSTVAFVSVATGTLLSRCCPETVVVYSSISLSWRSTSCTRYNIVTCWVYNATNNFSPYWV